MNRSELPKELQDLSVRAKKALCTRQIRTLDEFIELDLRKIVMQKGCGAGTYSELLNLQNKWRKVKPNMKWFRWETVFDTQTCEKCRIMNGAILSEKQLQIVNPAKVHNKKSGKCRCKLIEIQPE